MEGSKTLKRKLILLLIAVAVCLGLSGCGPDPLIELTDEQREEIVCFSAHIIGEFNKSQPEGLTSLSAFQLKNIDKELAEIDAPPIIKDDSDYTSEDFDDNDDNYDSSSVGEKSSFTDVIGVSGIKATVKGYEIRNDYVKGDAFAMTPKAGNKFLVVKIKLKNTSKKKIKLDLMERNFNVSCKINSGGNRVTAVNTLLPEDFINYEGSIKSGKSVNTVLIFEINESISSSIENIVICIGNGDKTQNIRIK